MRLRIFAFLPVALVSAITQTSAAMDLTSQDKALKTNIKYTQTAELGQGVRDFDLKLRQPPLHYIDSPEERENYRIIVKDCIAYQLKDGAPVQTQGHDQNHMQYVMDQSGNFFIFDENLVETVRHSSILNGGPVAGAGEFQTTADGKIIYVDNDSGHYVTGSLLPDVKQELVEQDGCKAEELTVTEIR